MAIAFSNAIAYTCPNKFSSGSFNPFPLRFLWTKEASQQDGKLRQAREQAREIP